MPKKDEIYVTKPFLPPLSEFIPMLEEIWRTRVLTNSGDFEQRLENLLSEFLQVDHLSLVSSGTSALTLGLKALNLSGEVITTPFTFPATLQSILWNGLVPKFVDIEPMTLNLDVNQVKRAITSKTSAILGVHCFGQPCETAAIRELADQYGLKVIYDGAHSFGVKPSHFNLHSQGDITALSFHATKVFNTCEGGAVVCSSPKSKADIDRLKNFGLASGGDVDLQGGNHKMSELHAALGILQLEYFDAAISDRKRVDTHYRRQLGEIKGIRLLELPDTKTHNYAYFPIIVEQDYPETRNRLCDRLLAGKIFARKYFYPCVHRQSIFKKFAPQDSKLPFSEEVADRIICLPIYPGLELKQIETISNIVSRRK